MQPNYQEKSANFMERVDNYDEFRRSEQLVSFNKQMGQNSPQYRLSYQGYQSRYPSSYGGQIGKAPNGEYREGDRTYMKVSPCYQRNGNSSNQRVVSNNSRDNLLISTNIQNDKEVNSRNYMSPSRGSFIASPYQSSNYLQNNYNYTPSNSNINNSSNLNKDGLLSLSPYNINKQRGLIDLQKLVSQLRLSLQQSLSVQSELQQQVNKERSRCFELGEMKRKLQEELSKMEFQLERITTNDLLGQRQLMIKYQHQLQQTQKLNQQLNDLMQELKRVKKQQRQLMTENNNFKQQNDLLKNHNIQLTQRIQEVVKESNLIKQQHNLSIMREKQQQIREKQQVMGEKQQEMRDQYLINQNSNYKRAHFHRLIPTQQSIQEAPSQHINSLNNITTTRTNNNESYHPNHNNNNIKPISSLNRKPQSPTNNHPPHYHPSQQQKYSLPTHQYQQNNSYQHYQPQTYSPPPYQEQINYDFENSKLVDDYNKLNVENLSMKKLYKEFYQQSPRLNSKKQVPSPPHSYQKSISQLSEEFEATDPDLNGQSSRLKTFQKNELQQQVSSLREEVINQLLINYYNQSTKQAQNTKANVLILFIQLLTKNISTIQKMVLNYLHARDLLKNELNLKKLPQKQQSQPNTEQEIQAHNLWENTKHKLKTELNSHQSTQYNPINQTEILTLNINAYFLALFRLLTLVQKYQNKTIEPSSETMAKIKHSALKYVHKIHEESYKLKTGEKKQDLAKSNNIKQNR